MTEDEDAVEALGRLGLSSYEARTFVALQKLGAGTASDVADVADVPRSQVYGAADSLEERGLVAVQQSSPIRYRPVALPEARERLEAELARERDRAFEHLSAVQGSLGGGGERPADVWTIRGRDAITDRAASLAGDAENRVLFAAADAALLPDALADALRARAEAGVSVRVLGVDEAARARFADSAVETHAVHPDPGPDESHHGRVVAVDGDTALLTVRDGPGGDGEFAVWSAGTAVGRMFAWFIEGRLQDDADLDL